METPVTDTAKLRELLAKATPGEWRFVPEERKDMGGFCNANGIWVCSFGNSTTYYPTEGTPPEAEDAALIVAAVNALPTLLAKSDRADALEAELAALKAGMRGLVERPIVRVGNADAWSCFLEKAQGSERGPVHDMLGKRVYLIPAAELAALLPADGDG